MCALFALFVGKLLFTLVDIWTLAFKTKVLNKIALGLAALGFLSCAYGVMLGRFNMTPQYVTVENKKLPHSFDGYKILHITDFHLSSLYGDKKVVSEWIDRMNAENPDMICFTGDIVSILSDEMTPFLDDLKRLKAKDRKFAIIGNHDYGYYHRWESIEKRDANLARTEELIRTVGFDLLLDENRTVYKDGDSIAVVGMENWGMSARYMKGNLSKAEEGVTAPTRILLSHDPDFWEKHPNEVKDYFLTLSGHTHAMQFGFELGDWKSSPSSLKYPYWYGLYERDGNQIFVSRGIGCTLIPIRLGMSPEYVVITLKNKS